MIWVILILTAVLLAVLEKFWAPKALKSMHFSGDISKVLAEPDEPLNWQATVENHSRLPIPFVRLQGSFPVYAKAQGDPRWIRAHCREGFQQWYVEERMSLLPWQACTRSVRFSVSQRGVYKVGAFRLSAGDLLGLKEQSKEGPGQELVVIPPKAQSRNSLAAFGGFLGDISVRRFILEDPILTVGFRDYTGREPLKNVSWTRTAVAGSMQVKQFDHTAEQTVMVLLDVEGGSPEELEACFSLMRMVCEELDQKKIPYGLRTNGNLQGPVGKLFYLADGLGASHLNTILYGLGRADYTCFYSLRYLVQQTLSHRRNNESYIVITPKRDNRVSSLLKKLETLTSNPVCILYGEEETEGQ